MLDRMVLALRRCGIVWCASRKIYVVALLFGVLLETYLYLHLIVKVLPLKLLHMKARMIPRAVVCTPRYFASVVLCILPPTCGGHVKWLLLVEFSNI